MDTFKSYCETGILFFDSVEIHFGGSSAWFVRMVFLFWENELVRIDIG